MVAESNLPALINELREALGDDSRRPRYVRTVYRFGYAFSAAVEVSGAPVGQRQVQARLFTRHREFPLFRGRNIIGRDGDVAVTLDDPTVSRRHAAIIISAAGARLEDLNSKNGTFVEGRRVAAPIDLAACANLMFGTVAVTFRASPGGDSTVSL